MTVDQAKSSYSKRRGTLALLAVIGCGSLAVIWWYRPANAEYRYSRMSLVALHQLLDREPGNATAWKQFAIRLAREADKSQSEPALLRALELNPGDAVVATDLGTILMAEDRYPEAFQLLKAATQTHPEDAGAHKALGELYMRKESFQHAYDEYAAVVKLDQRADDAWYEMCVCSLRTEQVAKAQEAIKRALAIKPDSPQYLVEQGAVDVAQGNVPNGITETERAAQLAPQDIHIQSALVNLLLEQHRDSADIAAAEAAIGRLEQLEPTFPPIPYMRGKLEMLKQNWPAAVRYLEISWQTARLHDEVCLALSQSYRRVNRIAEADVLLKLYRHRQDIRRQIGAIQDQLGTSPRDVQLYKQLADLEMQIPDRTAAAEVMKTGLQINPNDPILKQWMTTLEQHQAPSK